MARKRIGRVRVVSTGPTKAQAKANAQREANRLARQLKRKQR